MEQDRIHQLAAAHHRKSARPTRPPPGPFARPQGHSHRRHAETMNVEDDLEKASARAGRVSWAVWWPHGWHELEPV